MAKISYPSDEWGPTVALDGAVVPSRFVVVAQGDKSVPDFRIDVELIDGRWEAVALTITNHGQPLGASADGVKRIMDRLPKMTEGAVAIFGQLDLSLDGHGRLSDEHAGQFRSNLHTRQARRFITPEFLREVADVYLANPSRPTAAVRDRYVVAAPTATRWVKMAREADLIPERG